MRSFYELGEFCAIFSVNFFFVLEYYLLGSFSENSQVLVSLQFLSKFRSISGVFTL